MTWSCVELQRSLGKYQTAWNDLNGSLCGGNPYFHGDFMELLLRHFGSGSELLCVHRGPAGIDGLLVVTPSRPGKWTLFCPSQLQPVPTLVQNANALRSLVRSLPGVVLGLDLPRQDPCTSALNRCANLPTVCANHSHTIAIELQGAFEDYWAARARRDLRQNIGRRLRRLSEAGENVRLTLLESAEAMEAAVERFGDIESAGWKGKAGTAVHRNNAQGRFYKELMESFAARGHAHVYELWFGDRLAAVRLCISSDSMLVMLKTTYDENSSTHAPGRAITYHVVKREFDTHRFERIEFFTNADSELLSWATSDRWIQDCLLMRSGSALNVYKGITGLRTLASRRPGRS